MVLLQKSGRAKAVNTDARQPKDTAIGGARGDSVVEVRNLDRSFGKFVAVDHVSFDVKRGEIFGLLGPNGAGKTTTFRMLCGLLPPSGGTLTVAGVDVRRASASARQHLGYVAQKFSLYGQLTVNENLLFFARAYGLGGEKLRERIAWALSQNLAIVEDRGPIAILGLLHEMGGHDHRDAVGGKRRDPLPEFAAGEGIGAAGRLVQEKDLGPVQEGGGHGQALLEASR